MWLMMIKNKNKKIMPTRLPLELSYGLYLKKKKSF